MSLLKMPLKELNPHILCVLCGGYLVDATTIIECLHSFCRSCIVKYLEASFHCPVCDVEVHKTKPLLHIRRDRTLQEIVYKIVPGMHCEELNRRKEFEARLAKERPSSLTETEDAAVADKDSVEKERQSNIFADSVCITLEYFRKTRNRLEKEVFPTRYLRCSAAVTVRVLTKFLAMKFAIPDTHTTEITRCDEILDSHLTMKEISRMYGLYAKPFVDLQYVFLEKDDMPPRSEKPKSLEPKRKRIKKRKDKNLLKRCLVSGSPRQRLHTAKQTNSISAQLHSSENSQKCLVETRPSRPCKSEKEEELVPSPLHSCENVKKEELPSHPATCDMASRTLWNGAAGDKNQSVEKTDVVYPNTNADKGNPGGNHLPLLKNNAVENFNRQIKDVPAPVTKTNTQDINSLLITAPSSQVISQQSEQRDQSNVLSSNHTSSGSFTNDVLINHSLSHLENLFA